MEESEGFVAGNALGILEYQACEKPDGYPVFISKSTSLASRFYLEILLPVLVCSINKKSTEIMGIDI